MSVNRYQPHVIVIPEDDANRQLANGFLLHHAVRDTAIQIMPPVGGWPFVLQHFRDEYLPELAKWTHRHVVLLVDFDGEPSRISQIENEIPDRFRSRVHLIGTKNEPEDARKSLGKSLEWIGEHLAMSCEGSTPDLWQHEQFQHLATELEALRKYVAPVVFGNWSQS